MAPFSRDEVKLGRFREAHGIFVEGLRHFMDSLRTHPSARNQPWFKEFDSLSGFMGTLEMIWDSMTPSMLEETLRNAIRSIRRGYDNMTGEARRLAGETRRGMPLFAARALMALGPEIRVSKNEMTAWMRVPPEDAGFWTAEDLREGAVRWGIAVELDDSALENLAAGRHGGGEIEIARGTPPEAGEDGRVKYLVDVEDFGFAPRVLEDGHVSFKDIKLFGFVREGEPLAVKIPPVRGKPGKTVLGEPILPMEVGEAKFPRLKHTRLSEDGASLIAATDCCVTRKYGRVELDPTLRVDSNVSFATGNIESEVAVVVTGDVLTDFSVKSERGIHIHGVVEGASLQSKRSVSARGGVQGKDKAVLEAVEDVSAAFIRHATVNAFGDVLAGSEIVNSHVWAGGAVRVTGSPSQIIGGCVRAESEISADVVGSELGVETIVHLGWRQEELSVLLESCDGRIAEQEEASEKCSAIIGHVKNMLELKADEPERLEKALAKAEATLADARNNLESLYAERDGIQSQYDACLNRTRLLRVRKAIMPGTVIRILGHEMRVGDRTGPALAALQGDRIVLLPYENV